MYIAYHIQQYYSAKHHALPQATKEEYRSKIVYTAGQLFNILSDLAHL